MSSIWNVSTLPLFFITVVVIIYGFFRRKFSYWKSRDVPYLEPSIPFGNTTRIFMQKESFADLMYRFHFEIKRRNLRYAGYYFLTNPMLCVNDTELIKKILVKDFQYFTDREIYHDENFDPLSANLFSLCGHRWKSLRKTFTPTFTSGKIKMMFFTLMDCSKELENVLDSSRGVVDIKDIAARYTTDVIGSCAFGIDCNSLKNPEVEFRTMGDKVFVLTPKEMLKNLAMIAAPQVMKYFQFPLIQEEISSFFFNIVKQTVDYREGNQVERSDFMNLLIKLKNEGRIDEDGEVDRISFNQLAAQAFIFFIAGFETSSSTISFCMYELARNPEVQKKLRGEIEEVLKRNNGEVTYEDITEMKYLHCVIEETMRLYPILPVIFRKATENYHIPDSDHVIEKDVQVWIPLMGLQRDPDYFPDPEKFDPERFNEENKQNIPPFVYMPFGEGPRNCIGNRFGLLQTKIGIFALLRRHEFSAIPGGAKPMRFDSKSILLSPSERITLRCKKLL